MGRHFGGAFLALLVLTIYGSLLPFHFTSRPFAEALTSFEQISFYPTTDLAPRGDWLISTVQYALLSFCGLAAIAVDRSPIVGWIGALFVLVACFLLAIVIEFLQLFFPPRTVSVNDILAESIGAFLGIAVWLFAGQRLTHWLRRVGTVFSLSELAQRILPGYVAALIVVQLMPFDLVVGPNELAVKWAEGKINLIPFVNIWTRETLAKQLLTIASFLPVGIMCALAFRQRPGRAPAIHWQVFLLPAIIELAQLFMYSRSFDATDIFTGNLGIALGGHMANRIRQGLHPPTWGESTRQRHASSPIVWPALVLGWATIVAYLYWRPFDFTTNPTAFVGDHEELPTYGFRRMSLAPFVDYYWGSKYNALDNFVRKALAFLPLGVLMAWREQRLYCPWATTRLCAIAAILALTLEVGRYFLPGHSPSSTDILIFTAGAWFGYRLTRILRTVAWVESNSLTTLVGHC